MRIRPKGARRFSPAALVVLPAVVIAAGLSWFWYEVLLPWAAEADLFLWLMVSAAIGFYLLAVTAEKIAQLRDSADRDA